MHLVVNTWRSKLRHCQTIFSLVDVISSRLLLLPSSRTLSPSNKTRLYKKTVIENTVAFVLAVHVSKLSEFHQIKIEKKSVKTILNLCRIGK